MSAMSAMSEVVISSRVNSRVKSRDGRGRGSKWKSEAHAKAGLGKMTVLGSVCVQFKGIHSRSIAPSESSVDSVALPTLERAAAADECSMLWQT